ncbi:MAG TPA: gamma-glutamyl-gamma-aminobutyrate hydrolase family protein [Armatimonadota bacterium]|nr:gamma-glutamyl-gamma-aminobutyrate hydrolase family protein [Armatimonadota bacterium]
MGKPIIVVTAGKKNHTAHTTETSTIIGCDIDYLISVSLAGGAPAILPSVADHEAIRTVMTVADGLLLTGGGDIHAEIYGEELHPESTMHDPDRDNMEMEVARFALEMNMPILGICRGMQLLNVIFGGTLVQDIPSEIPGALQHSAEETEVVLHPITILEGTLLADVMHTHTMMVNTWHHQAVKQLGNGLRVSARADDGVVEAIESAEGKAVLAVQCHPEACMEDYPCYRTLFHWLIEEAQTYHARL